MSNFARIKVLNGKAAGFYEIPELGKLRIGRLPGCDVVIDGNIVSRNHCTFEYTNRRDRMENTSSTVTLLNGIPVEQAELSDGDIITVGNTLIQYVAPEAKRNMLRGEVVQASGEKRLAFVNSVPGGKLVGRDCGKSTLLGVLSVRDTMDVYIGFRRETQALTAVKVLGDTNRVMPIIRQRFAKGSEILSKLLHPGLPQLHDKGEIDGRIFTSVTYVDGADLGSMAASLGGIDVPTVLKLGIDICKLLEFLESKQIVLRNICPENLMVAHRDTAKIVNLDYATEKGIREDTAQTFASAHGSVLRHRAPEYYSRECVATPTADIFSLASVMYTCVSGGKAPWDPPVGDPPVVYTSDTFKKEPIPLDTRKPNIDPYLLSTVQIALNADATKRYSSPKEFRYELEAAAKSAGVRA